MVMPTQIFRITSSSMIGLRLDGVTKGSSVLEWGLAMKIFTSPEQYQLFANKLGVHELEKPAPASIA